MLEIRRILVATDFSEHADNALKTAVGLARTLDAKLDLAHVIHEPVPVVAPGQAWMPQDFWPQVRDAANRRLERASQIPSSEGIAVETHLAEGPDASAIVELADKLRSDLIVMGTRGLSGFKHVMLGSVAERTVRLAPCPVMTVRGEGADTREFRPRKVVVAMDFSDTSRRALEFAKGLAQVVGKVHLLLVHGYSVPVELELYAAQYTPAYLEHLSEHATRELEAILVDLQEAGISSEHIARRGSADHVVNEVAEEQGAALIVMGTHGRTGFSHLALGSVAERVVRTALCPVITVKGEKT